MTLRLALVACALWAAACDRDDPVLDPIRASLDHYDAGRAALEAGDPAAAREAFASARSSAPASSTLAAWEAHAAAASGDVAGALALLDAGLARWPDDDDLRYNRAALRSRSGDLDGAATDLATLYRAGAVSPRDAAEDPDFGPLAAHPQHKRLVPPPTVEVVARGEDGAVLLGEPWELELDVRSPAEHPLEVSVLVPSELLRLDEIVEELAPPSGRTQVRRLRLRWRGHAPGTSAMGPVRLVAGPAEAEVPVQAVEIVGLSSGGSARPGAPWTSLPLPSALGSVDPTPRVEVAKGLVVVTAPVSAQVELVDASGQPAASVRLELRQDDRALLQRRVLPRTKGRVAVRSAGLVLLEQPLP